MKILVVISHPGAAQIVRELSLAFKRKNLSYSLFFTGDGVTILKDNAVLACVQDADEAVVCEHAWQQFMSQAPCSLEFVEMGSQTDHSRLIKFADRLISL